MTPIDPESVDPIIDPASGPSPEGGADRAPAAAAVPAEDEPIEEVLWRFAEENGWLDKPRPPLPPRPPEPKSIHQMTPEEMHESLPVHLRRQRPDGTYVVMGLISRMQQDLEDLTQGKRAATYPEVDEYLGYALLAEGLAPRGLSAADAVKWWRAGGSEVLAEPVVRPSERTDVAQTRSSAQAERLNNSDPVIAPGQNNSRVPEATTVGTPQSPAGTSKRPVGRKTAPGSTKGKVLPAAQMTTLLAGSRHSGLDSAELDRSLAASVRDQAAIARAARARSKPLTRKAILLGGGVQGRIEIAENPKASAVAPIIEIAGFSEVRRNEKYIVEMSKKYAVDADLIRAIIYMESTHGWYDAPFTLLNMNSSIRPMNINTDYWGNAWGKRDNLKSARSNIEGGTRLLKAILRAMPGADIAKVATVFNNTNAEKVSDYGARVKAIYKSKAWAQQQAAPSQAGRPALPSTGIIRTP